MAQLPRIRLHKPCINLPFGDCAMYFEHRVQQKYKQPMDLLGSKDNVQETSICEKTERFFICVH